MQSEGETFNYCPMKIPLTPQRLPVTVLRLQLVAVTECFLPNTVVLDPVHSFLAETLVEEYNPPTFAALLELLQDN